MKTPGTWTALALCALLAASCSSDDGGGTADAAEVGADAGGDAVDSGDLPGEVVDPSDTARTLTLAGSFYLESEIPPTSGGAFVVLLIPQSPQAEEAAGIVVLAPDGYTGGRVEVSAETGEFLRATIGTDTHILKPDTYLGDPWEAEPGLFELLIIFTPDHEQGSHERLLIGIEVTDVPGVIEVGEVEVLSMAPLPSSCTYTQAIELVDESVDGSEPCGAGDGTCISGVLRFPESIGIQEEDIGEAYIFGDPTTAPLMIYRQANPPHDMPFKIPNIPARVTDACTEFEVGGRLDVGGNNEGLPGGPEDPSVAANARLVIHLEAGDQINGLVVPA